MIRFQDMELQRTGNVERMQAGKKGNKGRSLMHIPSEGKMRGRRYRHRQSRWIDVKPNSAHVKPHIPIFLQPLTIENAPVMSSNDPLMRRESTILSIYFHDALFDRHLNSTTQTHVHRLPAIDAGTAMADATTKNYHMSHKQDNLNHEAVSLIC